MPSFCCVPNWNQKGYTRSLGEKISLTFAKAPLMRKQWIHAIRREEGKDFVITERTKVCSVHFRSEDLRKSINGRIYIKEGGVPSKFDWSVPSPKKRKAPTERQPLPAKKKLPTEDAVCEPSTSFEDDTCKSPNLERQIAEQSTKIGELEEKLKQAESEMNNLRRENIELNEKLAECERQQKELSSRLFCVDRFTTDGDISFYTGLSSYATFMAIHFCASEERHFGEVDRPATRWILQL